MFHLIDLTKWSTILKSMEFVSLKTLGEIMRALKILLSLIALTSSFSYGEALPEIFESAKLAKLPISSGKSSYDWVFVSFDDDSKNASPKNRDDYEKIRLFHNYLMEREGDDAFSLSSSQWSQYRLANLGRVSSWGISRVPCDLKFMCYLLSPNSGVWLIIAQGLDVKDFQLVNANQYKIDAQGYTRGPIAQLDTMFGEVGLFPFPETDYEKTGIFCSVLTRTLPDGNEKIQIYKRRITPEGKIENKAMPEGAMECKLPW